MNFGIHDGRGDLQWILGFTIDLEIHDGFWDSQWILSFAMDSWIHDGFLDSRRIPGFAMDLKVGDRGLDSRCILGRTMDHHKSKWNIMNHHESSWIHLNHHELSQIIMDHHGSSSAGFKSAGCAYKQEMQTFCSGLSSALRNNDCPSHQFGMSEKWCFNTAILLKCLECTHARVHSVFPVIAHALPPDGIARLVLLGDVYAACLLTWACFLMNHWDGYFYSFLFYSVIYSDALTTPFES